MTAPADPQPGPAEPPAWRRPTRGEHRWPSTSAIVVVAVLQLLLPRRLSLHPRYLIPAIELALLAVLIAFNPGRIERRDPLLRRLSLVLTGILFAADAGSGAALVIDLLRGHSSNSPSVLLGTGGAIYATNVVVFALWYWELDRGGPVARGQGERAFPDFLFPQMQATGLVDPNWEPTFPDYLYLSFTNVTAFSPTDTLPLSRWAKLLMMLEATLAVLLVVLVIARAVNVLK
ncbi:MAG TPA: hypothetical protein VHZ96_17005 [Frankiaceae bacterium]|nr:hypothetical protein [Frankiaceae bacterium]